MSYKIHSWNGFLPKNKAYPYVYILPDPKLDTLLNTYGNRISVHIKGTNSSYDNLILFAKVETSETVPSYRPNFLQQTHFYSVVLEMPWNGYPPQNGQLEILDFAKYNISEDSGTITSSENVVNGPVQMSEIPINMIFTIVLSIVLLLLISIIVYKS